MIPAALSALSALLLAAPADPPLRPDAPPFPAATGPVISVSTSAELVAAVARVPAGGTILLADGRYPLTAPLRVAADRVTIRSRSRDRTRVILDGNGTLTEAIWVTGCSDVTIAHLTIQNVRWNGIKINSDSGVQRLRVYDCVFRNVWQRAIKGVGVPAANRDRLRPRDCVIEFCLFENDRPKQIGDDPEDTAATFGGDYVGGIDAMCPTGWAVRDNLFRGIRGRTRQGRAAVFLWVDARECVVERNVIVDCDNGVWLGNSTRDPTEPVHATGCVVRNNCVTRAPEGAITATYTRDCRIVHNTLFDPDSRHRRGVRVVADAPGLVVAYNLLAGVAVQVEGGAKVEQRGNVERPPAGLFANPDRGDLHLVGRPAGVVDAATPDAAVTEDLDRRRRGPKPDIGAHEASPE
ncbi:MAG TPA: right-handed parallel beta-helix repeat-containing protein [Urbifossiella sp.]|nr:right-handed parallel beta-helix repeat-containing protein [Urbifossiella sp.]